MFELELPYPPSVNHYWRRVGQSTLISREGRRFRSRVVALVAALRPEPALGPLDVSVDVYPPDRRRRDLDNLLKSLLDSLEHAGVYPDDSEVVHLDVRKREVVPGGKCVVRIREA